ncbi:MAG: branched-chain amino acid transporter permease [Proteobacteria bacterium]|nr:branched-chain amino acid transporter permease [Pseudomonadota bacterium]RPJ48247.1 MAG: branched-chain amino acid ABC transporter permease [Betaproteobacteria bacterium]
MRKAFDWWWGIALAFSLLAAMRAFLPLPFVNEILIFSIYAIGCSFLLGRVGFISFGQPAYLAIGAYGTAFYLFYFGTNPYIGILAGLASGFIAALIVGPLFVRLRSDYFALVNLALAVIVFFLMQKVLAPITKGDNGLWFLTNMTSTPVLDITRPSQFFVFAFIVGLAIWAFYKYLDDTLFGACCLATKINEDKLQFLGYSNFSIRLAAFVIANTTTALAGSLYAVYIGAVSPEITSPARAADPVVVILLGGAGTLYGPIVGSIAYTGMKDVISKLIGNWEMIIGPLLVIIMLAGEKGIWGTLEPWLKTLLFRNKSVVPQKNSSIEGN